MNGHTSSKAKQNLTRFFLIIFLLVFSCTSILAQDQDTVPASVYKPEKALKRIHIRQLTKNGFKFWQDDFSGHWAGIDFGFNLLLNPDYKDYNSEFMDIDELRSNSAYFNVLQQSIGLQCNRNKIGLVTGLGLHLQGYRLNDNITIFRDGNSVIQPESLVANDNQKSKLALISFMVPVLLEFQIPVNHYDNRIYFSAGPYGEVKLNSHTKVKYKTDQKEKLKVGDHFSLRDFRYGLMVRTGYRSINFFATCDLVPLFRDERGPELTPFTVGITLIRF
ncbi:outer membrane beta-barrel protein [Maribellus sp. YY47]|uniref:outer membrane beta-barrel protein n=1 Tax=Maribellus sp. YY47 TaxID=2929486 RepID=UPI0020016119|nr:outer membrane beta-barrel protein [Maribellus sp. YY47]MCK3683999.1 PorT family protein [Maribellus sp. YY47]